MDNDTLKQNITTVFDLVANEYNNPATRFFAFTADRIVDHLKPRPNSRILDVACGTGIVTITLAPMLLPGGRVQAIDLSEKMLDVAEQQIKHHGLDNVDLHLMDAERLDFKRDYFDAIVCSFGLFFIPDMSKALCEWRRVLKPQGQLMFTSFASTAFKPLADLFIERIQGFGVEVDKARWQRLETTADCQQLLDACEYTNIETHTVQLGYHLGSEQDWWELCWSTGFRGMLEQLSALQLAEFRQQHLEDIAKQKTEQGIWLDIEVIFSLATK